MPHHHGRSGMTRQPCAAPGIFVKLGGSITVKCIGIDERSGKVRLSRKAAMRDLEAQKQNGGAPAEAAAPAAQ
jgi:polyribonucleotide nucleotidyltransferase